MKQILHINCLANQVYNQMKQVQHLSRFNTSIQLRNMHLITPLENRRYLRVSYSEQFTFFPVNDKIILLQVCKCIFFVYDK